MLSIGKLAAGQESYYEQQVALGRDDYYSGRGESAGRWLGTGADELELEGELDGAAFAALLGGHHPQSGERLRSRSGSVTAFDLTFSAPKSVSVLFAIGDEATSRALVSAHEEAVEAALAYLEAEACWIRRGTAGVDRRRGRGFVAAAYRHRMSRAEDPQLHTHVVTANAAQGEDGRWYALDGRALYAHAEAAGFLYQAHLRAAVRERLPWAEWGPARNGMAEICGVPDGVLREFSTRRRRILERARELELAGVSLGDAGRERIAHDTRSRKRLGVDTGSWRDLVGARAAEHGLGGDELRALTARRPGLGLEPRVIEEGEAERLAGPSGLTERCNTFGERGVVMALAAAQRQGDSAECVTGAARRFCRRADVVALDPGQGSTGVFTTRELLECEADVLLGAAGRRGTHTGLVAARDVEQALSRRKTPLTDEQAAAVRGIASSGHGIEAIEALAGTGKTTTAGALADVYRGSGYSVLGVAPTGRAVRELKERAGIGDARTLAGLLVNLDRRDGRFPLGPTVLIFDEAGMASTREAARLLAAAEAAGVKVIALGDSGQLPAVQAGGWFGALVRRFGAHELRQVMRQRDPRERALLEGVRAGEPDEYLEHKQEAGELRLFEGPTAARNADQAALSAWHRQEQRSPEGQAVMICRDNTRRGRLNEGARMLLSADGRLGASVSCESQEFAVGDRVICRRNAPALDVDNGTRGTISAVDARAIELTTDSGASRRLPSFYWTEHLEHAYALTAHGLQGATVDWATVIGTPQDFSRNWSYTALSRSREPTELFLIDCASVHLEDRAEIAPTHASASDAVETMKRQMRTRDDEDLAAEHTRTTHLALPPIMDRRQRAERTIEL